MKNTKHPEDFLSIATIAVFALSLSYLALTLMTRRETANLPHDSAKAVWEDLTIGGVSKQDLHNRLQPLVENLRHETGLDIRASADMSNGSLEATSILIQLEHPDYVEFREGLKRTLLNSIPESEEKDGAIIFPSGECVIWNVERYILISFRNKAALGRAEQRLSGGRLVDLYHNK